MKQLKDRLKAARRSATLTQAQLAGLVGVSQAAIAALETGERKTSRKVVEIANALKVSPLWLAKGQGNREVGEGECPSNHDLRIPSGTIISPRILLMAEKLSVIPPEKLKAISILLGIKL